MSIDTDFMKRATKITSFNLISSDFTSLKYKEEIQTLYRQHMFGTLDLDKDTISGVVNVNKFNNTVRKLKKEDAYQFEKLHMLNIKGVGPGEATLFLLSKDGHLGGGSSAGVDFVIGSNKYEVKAVNWLNVQQKEVNNFKLGGNISGMVPLMRNIQELAYNLKVVPSKGVTEISTSKIDVMKKQAPGLWEQYEETYQKLAGSYFKNHEVIFIQNQPKKADFGEIIAMKKVNPKDIRIERLTSGVIKPIVKV